MMGGEGMIRAAMANGIDTIFGIPGAQIYPMFDAMQRLGVNTITTRHEQGAAYMALGYAQATGGPSAYAVVPGPGVLNTTAALCTAMGTNAPVLCLTGQVPRQFLGVGRGHLHELPDQKGTLASFIKAAHHIEDPARTGEVVNEAFNTMLSGRPGPVSIEMCWDTMAAEHQIEIGSGHSEPVSPQVDQAQIDAAAEVLSGAKRPLIMCGGGAQHASTAVLELAEKLGAPVTAFRSGRGVVSEDHPLGVSSVAARLLYDDADVVVGIGSRLEMIYMRWRDMNTYEQRPNDGPTLIRIDVDESEFDRFVPDVAVLADAKDACLALSAALSAPVGGDNLGRVSEAKSEAARITSKIQPQMSYLQTIRDVLPRDGFFVPELSQIGFTSYFGFPVYEPRTYVTEGYQGTLGFGFQTALGVKVACPDRAVVAVTGDGGFMFGVQELATAVNYNIGVVVVVFNNGTYANVRRDQERVFEGRVIGADFTNPDFVQLAESFGAAGYRVDSPQGLRPVLEKAIADDRPAVIDVQIEKGSEVSPWEFIMMPNRPS
ncbi:MAG: hypothetical protein GKR90_23345 [Pseudomonadales bacterium]|nr:hypothetical protein [Pseudomonadales bacterium]